MKELYLHKTIELWCLTCKKITKFDEMLCSRGGYLKGVICHQCKENRQKKEPSYYSCHPYKVKCKCGKEKVFLSQDDNSPEYYSTVGMVCDCGEIVWVTLPVN